MNLAAIEELEQIIGAQGVVGTCMALHKASTITAA